MAILRRSRCRHCGRSILLTDALGWQHRKPGHAYQAGPGVSGGQHRAEPKEDVPIPGYAGYEERIIREHGRCICPSVFCMAEPNDKGEQCGYCANVDPEWPCPHDPDVPHGPFVAGDRCPDCGGPAHPHRTGYQP